ncbi:MAG: hypothetical protein ACJ8GW_18175 [Massilia sp.]
MASHHFYHYRQLPERVQRQLVRAIADRKTYLRDEGHSNAAFYGKKGAILALLTFLLVWLVQVGFGEPEGDPIWSNPQVMPVYLALLAPMIYLVIIMVQRFRLARLFGFQPGQYLFANTLIDARDAELTIVDLVQLAGITATERHVNNSYNHTTFTFAFPDAVSHTWKVKSKKGAQQFGAKFNALQGEAHAAMERKDMASMLRLDPCFEIRRKDWVVPELEPIAQTMPVKLLARPWITGIVVGLLLMPLIWLARNAIADNVTYKAAKQENTEAAYLGYVKHGKFHVDEARAALPRVAFEEARKKYSVTAMRTVLQKYPNTGLDADGAAHIHSLYQKALATFKERATETDPALLETMERLLLVLEKRGNPQVGIRFTRPSPEALQLLDANLKSAEAHLGGKRIIPAAVHFGNDSANPREARIGVGMKAAFHTIFPNDILDLYVAGPVGTKLPMIDISYDIAQSGMVFTSDDKERAFVGLVVRFQAALKVDETSAPWKFDLQVLPPDHFVVQSKVPQTAANKYPPEGEVYAVMAERAFDELAVKMHRAFFRKDAEPIKRTAAPVATGRR